MDDRTNKETTFVSVRLSPELGRKLDQIAQKTHRTRSHVIRLLLSHTEIPDQPDLVAVTPALAAKKGVVK